jgi:chitinase
MKVPKLFKQCISALMVILALSTSCSKKSVTVSKNGDADNRFQSDWLSAESNGFAGLRKTG